MNHKATLFNQYLEKNKPEEFTVWGKDDTDLVIFESKTWVKGLEMPTFICMDNTIYTEIEILAFNDGVNAMNRQAVMDCLNELNRNYKASKFYLDKEDNIVLNCCIPGVSNNFRADLVLYMIRELTKILEENFIFIMLKLSYCEVDNKKIS